MKADQNNDENHRWTITFYHKLLDIKVQYSIIDIIGYENHHEMILDAPSYPYWQIKWKMFKKPSEFIPQWQYY